MDRASVKSFNARDDNVFRRSQTASEIQAKKNDLLAIESEL